MQKVSSHKVGLALGAILAIYHATWATIVFLGFAEPLLDWILKMHFLYFEYAVEPFVLSNAVILVLLTGFIGYVMGYILGLVWNLLHKASHSK